MTDTPPRKRFALLDRDGTIIEDRHYLGDPDGVVLLPGAAEGLRLLQDLGFGLIVLTNQSGIARGRFDESAMERVHERLNQILAAEGVRLDGVYHCPHGPDDGCPCRKPALGMVEAAAGDHGFDPAKSVVIGDKASDMALARNAGALAVLVRTGKGAFVEQDGVDADAVRDHLADAAAWIREKLSDSVSG